MQAKSLFVLAMALAAAPVAMAQNSAVTGATVQTSQQGVADPATAKKPPQPGDRNCIQSTGSLIPAKPGTCLPVAGRSYSNQDIRNTGSPTVGPALQQLDPSITVSGGR